MSSRSLRSRRRSPQEPARHLHENGTTQRSSDSLSRSAKAAAGPQLELSDPRVDIPPMEVTAKMKIDVQLNVQIFRVRKIDNSTEEITLDLGITFMWNDPHLIHSTNGKHNFSTHPSISRFKPFPSMKDPQLWPDHLQVGYGSFDPAWKIENCSSMEIIKSICMVIDPAVGKVHNYIHLVATIHHELDMRRFPFDSQEFMISIRSEHSDKVMQFVRFLDKREPKIFHVKTTEWIVQQPLSLIFEDDNPVAASGARYVCAQFKFRAVRKPEWYIYNVLLTSWLIVTASFSVFFIPEENISERLGMIFTTWLLLISLKFVVADRLPKIAYLTIMDMYMIFSYVMMMALIAHTCIMGTMDKYFSQFSCVNEGTNAESEYAVVKAACHFGHTVAHTSDIYFMLAYLVIWSAFQLVIYVYYYGNRSA